LRQQVAREVPDAGPVDLVAGVRERLAGMRGPSTTTPSQADEPDRGGPGGER
jgi:hypothetical protein